MSIFPNIKIVAWVLLLFIVLNILPYIVVRASAKTNAVKIFEDSKSQPEFAGSVRIAVYNIAHGRGGRHGAENWNGETRKEKTQRLYKIAHFLKQQEVDVVVLNEVDFESHWSLNLNQAEIIANKAEFPYRVEQRNYDLYHPFFKLRFGNAVLSKYPVDSARLLEFTPLSLFEKVVFGNHDAAVVNLVLDENEILTIAAIHMEVREKESRLDNFETIQQLSSKSNVPVVLAGDFNSVKNLNGESTSLIDKLTDIDGVEYYPSIFTSDQNTYTFPSEKPIETLDWVIAPPSIDILRGQIPRVNWSDHLPIIVDLRI